MPTGSDNNSVDAWVRLLRTLADPVRIRVLQLMESGGRPALRVGEISSALKMPQSTVSRHLKTLLDCGLIESRRQGTAMLYRPSSNTDLAGLKELRNASKKMLHDDDQLQTDLWRLGKILEHRHDVDVFAETAPEWDSIRGRWFGETFQYEAMLASLNPQWAVADIGAGTASLSVALARHVARVYAIEPSQAMLKTARQRIISSGCENIELLAGSLGAIPVAADAVNLAIASLVLHHVKDIAGALDELCRIVCPGGSVLIIDLLPHQIEYFREKMGHRWMGFKPHDFQRQLSAAGFSDSRWYALPARTSELKDTGVRVPDLFVMRGTKPLVAAK